MSSRQLSFLMAIVLSLSTVACSALSDPATTPTTPPATATPFLSAPIQPGASHPNEPVRVVGEIPFTSPFFLNTIAEPFVLLEDEAGFIHRDRQFEFSLASQVLGPVELIDDSTLSYSLNLPSVPQGTLVDLDNDADQDLGVMVFAIAYWSNTWGDPFLERRDGTGWSNAYTSAITNPDLDDEIVAGKLMLWAPDEDQGFPTGFGPDGLLFTEDDPTTPVPAGYSIVDLDQDPFKIYKEVEPFITLYEGDTAVNDYSLMDYEDAFDEMFEKVSREYPFTEDKGIDWDAIYKEFSPQINTSRNDAAFYEALHAFSLAIPDGHVGISFDADIFYNCCGGGFGLVVHELTDGRVLATQVLQGSVAEAAGIVVGAEILRWNDQPIEEAIQEVEPFFGPYSTDHHRRLEQAVFLTRVEPGARVTVEFRNPGDANITNATLTAEVEYDSLFASMTVFSLDELELPLVAQVLPDSGIGYIRITTFSDDYSLMTRLWDRYMQDLLDAEVPALILDLRLNGGGSGGLALDFAGYFFDDEFILARESYYNYALGGFKPADLPTRVIPGPTLFDGPLAVLISSDCASACEGFAYAVSQGDRALVIGHTPSAGMFGEVGRGQYELPGGISMQFPTGRPETADGDLLIENTGVLPDIVIPFTEESELRGKDTVLQAAIDALLEQLQR